MAKTEALELKVTLVSSNSSGTYYASRSTKRRVVTVRKNAPSKASEGAPRRETPAQAPT
ncbi:hypothetical protein M407DRAFT_245148 [Tulasnella calospora MUT 4182]|uniref:Uncharacterized protein n=1 Tax=Tulasnella calospora MUT 4182 TaxID=1051891 RepID=A0A0C3QBJ2_9AGAM|nr:hypothetical protein M407DRAFT_245148 [Tulasnella calospora MUT 4182]